MKNLKLPLNLILIISLASTFISCNKNNGPVFEKYLKLQNATWDRFDQKFFEIPGENPEKSFDITFIVRHNARFAYNVLPFYIILTAPSGTEQIREIKIPLSETIKPITDSTADIHESRIVLWENLNLGEKGTYKISIENMIPKIQTEGIDEIGIVVTEPE